MDISQTTPRQFEFLTLLEAFSESVPVDILAELTEISAGELHTLIRKLVAAGLGVESGENDFGFTKDIPTDFLSPLTDFNSRDNLTRLLNRIKSDGYVEKLPSTAYHRLLSRCNLVEEVAELSYLTAQDELSNARFEKALVHLDECLNSLENHLDTPESTSLYILATLRIAGLIKPRHKALDIMESRLVTACQSADRMGDRRNQAFLSLYQGFLAQDRNRVREAMDYLDTGLSVVQALGDEEITLRAAEFYGYYYYNRGLMREASGWFERARTNEITQELKQFRNYLDFPIYFAHSAAFNGQFNRAVGILHALLHGTENNGNLEQARLCRANLGSVLLMMGNNSEAYHYLEESLEDALQEEDLITIVCALNARAWYFLQEGDVRQSYMDLRDSLATSVEIGSPQPYHAFPWNLELLFEFHKSGYKSLDQEAFEREMAYAEKGVNIMMRGVAFRIRAKHIELDGGDPTKVRRLLEKSLSDLIRANNPVELAKTRAEIARLYLNDGDMARARDEAMQASMAFGYDGFSDELKPLIRSMDMLPSMGDYRKDWLTRYIELMSRLMPRDNQAELMSSLITSTCTFFESERGGVFGFEADSQQPYLETGSNLTPEDTESDRFLPQLKLIKKAQSGNRPLIDTVLVEDNNGESRESRVLCLPFHTLKLPSGVLYYDNTWSEGVYKNLDPAVLMKITNQLGSYMDSIDSFSNHMKEISRQAIVQTVKKDTDKHEIITEHPAMLEILNRARQVAPSEAPVLIQGETGVGKELLARFVHKNSLRNTMPFIAVNLSSIPENLLESELFGHEKGAFTGAVSRKPGLIELADKGTLFIDEVGDIPKSIQVKMLRALQEETFMRVGGVREYVSDFRIVAATNREMLKEVAAGNFREDLYYRINIVSLEPPPLRERGNDIISLAEHFLFWYARQYNRDVPVLSRENRAYLQSYHWPGNVRELRNVIERAILLSQGKQLDLSLPTKAPARSSMGSEGIPGRVSFPDNLPLEELEKRYIAHILKQTGGKMSGPGSASKILGLNRSTLYSRMRKMGILDSLSQHR